MANLATLNFDEQIKEAEARITQREIACGKQLFQPFTNTISGSRKILSSTNRDQALSLFTPEVPLVGTGYENEFGKYTSSYITANEDCEVVAKIPKYSSNPNHQYLLITVNEKTKAVNVIERVEYKHITEAYGFMLDNKYIDRLNVGDGIQEGTVIQKSNCFDSSNNRMDGVNLRTAYISCDKTMEDGVILSKSAALKLSSPLVKVVEVVVNDNDIMLNLYGDSNNYKVLPDIGEEANNGILCALRRENKEESLFSQSFARLREINMSDDKYTASGEVMDIRIYCNNPDALKDNPYSQQLKYYYDQSMEYYTKIVDVVSKFERGYTLAYDLQKIYYNAKQIISGMQYRKDDKVFSNICMEIVLLERNQVKEGDKLCDRYGGKGIVAYILPDELLPRIDNDDDETIEIIYNSSTCVNRLNPGQLIETSITHIGERVLDYIKTNLLDASESLQLIIDYIRAVNPQQAEYYSTMVENMDDDELIAFVGSFIDNDGINISVNPISDSLSIDDLARVYEDFGWATQYYLKSPIKGSDGKIRYVKSRRPITCGKKYIYRLKQYAEEKFSVTSLSSTNIKGQNSKSKANKLYKGAFTKTPIRFGYMEIDDLGHLGMEYVITLLMIYSSSPQARRLCEELYSGDPFNVDIKLDATSKNRNVEILNAYFKTMGLRLVFDKIPIKKTIPIIRQVMIKYPIIRKVFITEKDNMIKPIIPGMISPIVYNRIEPIIHSIDLEKYKLGRTDSDIISSIRSGDFSEEQAEKLIKALNLN